VTSLLEVGLTNAVLATVLAIAVLLIGLVIRRRPALLHALWLVVLIKLLTPPLWSVPVLKRPALAVSSATLVGSIAPQEPEAVDDFIEGLPVPPTPIDDLAMNFPPSSQESDEPSLSTTAEAGNPVVAPGESISEVAGSTEWSLAECLSYASETLLALWSIGTLSWLGFVLFRVILFQRLLRHARPAPEDLQERAEYLAKRLGLPRSPAVWLAPGTVSPMLWALGWRPRLILPERLVDRLTWSRLDTLLLHELAHVRRRDHWVRWLELVVTGLYWWHPVVWWARRELREAEEHCCDAWVVWALPQATRSYALALVETVDFLADARPGLPLVASGFGHVNDLKRRLTMIMSGQTPRALTWAGCLTVLGLGAALIAIQPTWADDEEKPRARGGEERRDPEKRGPRAEEPGRGPREGERGREELERARNEVREMAEQVRRMQRQLQEAEERLRDASQRLERMAGGRETPPAGGGRGGPGGGPRGPGVNVPGTPAPPGFPGGPGAGGPGGPGGLPGAPGFGPRGGGGMAGFGGGFGRGGDGDTNRRLDDLERKIDQLIREFERMRGDRREGPRESPPPVRRVERDREPEGGARGDPPRAGYPTPPTPPTPPRREGDTPRIPARP
jgi:beta-lactamase regulating signal transducer with metallopeptidase domain